MPLPPLGVEVRFNDVPAQSDVEEVLADIAGFELTVTDEVEPVPTQPLLSVTVTE